jgi:hypothetical protein
MAACSWELRAHDPRLGIPSLEAFLEAAAARGLRPAAWRAGVEEGDVALVLLAAPFVTEASEGHEAFVRMRSRVPERGTAPRPGGSPVRRRCGCLPFQAAMRFAPPRLRARPFASARRPPPPGMLARTRHARDPGMTSKNLLLALLVLFFLSACAHQPAALEPGAPGFLMGLVHGAIAPVSLVAGIFTDVRIYAFPNGGGWYDLGFLLGVGVWSGGSAAAARRKIR